MRLHGSIPRWIAAFVLALTPAASWAQNTRGSINGVVKDTSGAVVPGAAITITEQEMGVSFTVHSQNDGSYLVPDLLPGDYTVAGEAKGFKRMIVSALKLDAGTTLTQDLILQVGQTNESITVAGTSSLVETTTNMVGTTIDATHMLELPLADRQLYGLVNLVPGAYYTRSGDNPALNYGSSAAGPGSRQGSMLYMIDGVDNDTGTGSISAGVGSAEIQPPPDVLEEFRVQTNNLSAEYGHASTAMVNAVTKGGTNQFHGVAYEFFRNSYFDAAGWGNNTKPLLQQNVPGGTIGGPIRKNKTFFFFAYEKLFNNLGTTAIDSVGLPAWRTGDFSTVTRDANGTAVLVPIYDPMSKGTQVFSGNLIPSSRLNSVALKLLSYVPLPNQKPIDPFNNSSNFQAFPVSPTRRPFYMGRVDHNFGSNNKLYFRYIYTPQDAIRYSGSGGAPQWGAIDNAQHTQRNDQSYALSFTHLFSPTFFMDALAGVQREWLETGNILDPNINWPQQFGIGTVPGHGTPSFNIAGGLVPFDSVNGGVDRLQTVTVGNYPINFTKVMNTHTFKFGFMYDRLNNNFHFLGAQASGTYTFNGTYTQGIGANGLPLANTGINLADFLLGYFSSVSINGIPSYGLRMRIYAGYFQDDWRVSPNLTLNLGLRYETITPPFSPTNVLQSFDPYVPNPGAGNGSIPAGAMGITTFENRNGQGKYLWNWEKKDGFSPRFGFAYRLLGSNDTVIRGGFGLFWDNALPNGVQGALGFSQTYTASYTANSNPSPLLGPTAVPAGAVASPPASALTPTFGDVGTQFAQSSISFYYPNRANPYTMQFNLSVQHQWKGTLFEVGYLGTLGRHLAYSVNVNLVPPQLLSQTSIPLALRRPFTEFSGSNASVISAGDTNAVSDYHALTLKSERRFSNGFSWLAAFTWSKWIDNAPGSRLGTTQSGESSPSLMNIYNRSGEKSLSAEDVPYRLVFSPIVELPFGKGKHWLNQGGVVNALAGGWEMALMGTLQAGSPISPSVLNGGNNVLGDPLQTERPNLVPSCNPNSPNQWQPAAGGIRGIQYLNAACFAVPAPFTYGNQSRFLPNVFGPGIAQFNLMLSKNFRFGERYRAQFRAEAIDLFNTPQFSLPAESLNGGNFGIITSTDGFTRRIMDFALKLYW